MKVFLYTWPGLLIFILFLTWLDWKPTSDFYNQLIATLIGVLAAFWLSSIYDVLIQRKKDKITAIRTLALLKQELHYNKETIEQLKESLNLAITLKIHAFIGKGIKEFANNIETGSFYAAQSSKSFETLGKNLSADIMSAYMKLQVIRNVTRFATTREELEPDNGKNKESQKAIEKAYTRVSQTCHKYIQFVQEVIGKIDSQLLKMGEKFIFVKSDQENNNNEKL